MNRKISVNLALAIAIIAMTVTFSVTMILSQNLFDKTVSSVREKEIMYDKLAEIDKTVRVDYYGTIDDDTLYDMLGAGFMAGISDGNAQYYTAKRYIEYLNEQAGTMVGIGVDFIKETGSYPRVIRAYSGSPAEDLGITNGYTLQTIDGTDLKTLTQAQISTLLRGEQGTSLMLSFADRGGNVTAATEVQRRQYETPSVEVVQSEGNTIGYVKIITFNANTSKELQQAISNMQVSSQGLLGLIVDVRGNTGGTLKYALDVIDTLCPSGPMGYQTNAKGEAAVLGISDDATQLEIPVVVLVNSSTAAGAELVAAAVRDFGVGQVVGTTTAGKATVQCAPVRLSDGSAISYTIGVLTTGLEQSFNGVGITPDVEAVLKADEEKNFYDLTVDSDSQIAKAREVLSAVIARQPLYETTPAETESTPPEATAESVPEEATSTESEAA